MQSSLILLMIYIVFRFHVSQREDAYNYQFVRKGKHPSRRCETSQLLIPLKQRHFPLRTNRQQTPGGSNEVYLFLCFSTECGSKHDIK